MISRVWHGWTTPANTDAYETLFKRKVLSRRVSFDRSIGHTRYSYQIISRSDGFVIDVPSKTQAEIVDYCGTFSGKKTDKFKACNLTPFPSTKISSPAILEFPLNIECATRKSVNLGSHSFFFGEIMAVHCDESILDEKGTIDKRKLQPMCAFLNSYWSLGDSVLEFGRSRLIPRRRKQTP